MQDTEAANSAVKWLLVELNKRLRLHGFRRRGQNFARQSDECWQTVNVQLSRFSSPGEKSLTVNIGVQSKAILRFRERDECSPPPYYTCPINFRIGWLMQGSDNWWTVQNEISARTALTEIDEVLQTKAVPFLDVLQTNKGIIDLFQTGQVLRSEIERDETRLLLLATAGATDEVRKNLDEYRARWLQGRVTDRALKFLKTFDFHFLI